MPIGGATLYSVAFFGDPVTLHFLCGASLIVGVGLYLVSGTTPKIEDRIVLGISSISVRSPGYS